MCPPSSVYLAALFKRFESTWAIANRVSLHEDRLGRKRDRQPMAMRVDDRPAGLHRVGDDGGDGDDFLMKADLAPGHPGNFQQIVNELCELPRLMVDHVARPAEGMVFRTALLHDLDGIANGGQRVAQLVPQHRQELVLAGVSLTQLAGVLAELVFQMLPLREVEAECHEGCAGLGWSALVEQGDAKQHGKILTIRSPAFHLERGAASPPLELGAAGLQSSAELDGMSASQGSLPASICSRV